MADGLEALRREIDSIDSEILSAVARRIEVARRIGAVKASSGSPARDPEREAEIERRWAEAAARLGIPVEAAARISRIFIQASLQVQRPLGEGLRVAVIGYGGMARVIARLSIGAGHSVVISGRDLSRAGALAKELGCRSSDVPEAVEGSKVVILAVSRKAFEEGFVEGIAGLLRGRVVMDILSAKEGVFEALEDLSRKHGFSYVSAHPLFGPYSDPYGESVVIIPSSTGLGALGLAESFWISLGASPVVASYDEHERAMAVVQVLPHLYMLALSRALERLSRILGVDYKRFMTANMRRLEAVMRILGMSSETVMEIQRHNAYAREARRIGAEALGDTLEDLGGRA